jgi:hypothetical protein
MKTMLFLLAALSIKAQALTYTSVYDGEQFQLAGFSLVQSAENPAHYYVLPNQFRIKASSYYDQAKRDYVLDPGVVHQVEEVDGHEFSIYTFRFALRSPSKIDELTAGMLLKAKKPGSVLQGMAKPCGMSLSVPGFSPEEGPGDGARMAKSNPNVPYVQYSISSTEAGRCNSFDSLPKDLTVTYRVPMSREPMTAQSLISGTGILIPPMTLLFPYKYTDKFSISLKKKSAMTQLQALIDLKGTVKMVTGQVRAGINKMIKNLEISGAFHQDCRSPQEVCAKYLEMAKSMVEARLVTYTPIKEEAKDLVIGDSDKDASVFKVALAFDYKTVTDNETFDFVLSNTNYSSISTQAHFRAARIPVEVLDPKVRAKF